MTYTIIDPGSGYQIHRAGCAHLARRSMVADIREDVTGATIAEALDRYFDDELRSMGWSPDDCWIAPCAQSPEWRRRALQSKTRRSNRRRDRNA